MDGGASVIAFVTLAGQLAKCILQAKELWDQVKNVPREITELIEDMQVLELIYRGIEEEHKAESLLQDAWVDSSARRAYLASKRARSALDDLVNDLNRQLQAKKGLKKKITAVKIVLKKDVLDRLQQRLERSLGLLNLSMQLYSMAHARLSPGIIATQVTSALVSEFGGPCLPRVAVQQPNMHQREHQLVTSEPIMIAKKKQIPPGYMSSRNSGLGLGYTRRSGKWQAQLRLPAWVSEKTYELYCSTALSGWTINCRVYNEVPRNSEIITKVRCGDRKGVMELFSSGQASPFDTSESGYSLLYYAAEGPHFEMCQLLLRQGLRDVLDDPFAKSSPLLKLRDHRPAETALQAKVTNRSETEQLAQVTKTATLFRHCLQDPGAIPADGLLNCVSQYAFDELVRRFQDMFMPDYCDLLLTDRLEAVRLGAFNVRDDFTLRKFISPDLVINRSDVRQSTREKLSLVHSAAVAVGCRIPDELKPNSKRPNWVAKIYGEGWDMFVTEIMSVSDAEDLHSIECVVPWDGLPAPVWRGTPLTSLIGGVLCYVLLELSLSRWESIFQGTLHHWLSLLQSAGVDLLGYGQREVRLLHNEDWGIRGAFDADAMEAPQRTNRKKLNSLSRAARFGRGGFEPRDVANRVPIRILDLTVGQSPSDWKLIWAPEFEYMAGQFWRTIEEPQDVMPGSWIDG